MTDTPMIIKLELDHVRETLSSALSAKHEAFTAMIDEQLKAQLTLDWVQDRIAAATTEAIKQATTSLAADHSFHQLIKTRITENLGLIAEDLAPSAEPGVTARRPLPTRTPDATDFEWQTYLGRLIVIPNTSTSLAKHIRQMRTRNDPVHMRTNEFLQAYKRDNEQFLRNNTIPPDAPSPMMHAAPTPDPAMAQRIDPEFVHRTYEGRMLESPGRRLSLAEHEAELVSIGPRTTNRWIDIYNAAIDETHGPATISNQRICESFIGRRLLRPIEHANLTLEQHAQHLSGANAPSTRSIDEWVQKFEYARISPQNAGWLTEEEMPDHIEYEMQTFIGRRMYAPRTAISFTQHLEGVRSPRHAVHTAAGPEARSGEHFIDVYLRYYNADLM